MVEQVFCKCAKQSVEKLKPDILNGSPVNMEEKFSQLTLDVIGLSLLNYNLDLLMTNNSVIDSIYTVLKEVELCSTYLLSYWKVREEVSSAQLRDDLLSILVAGHETSSSTAPPKKGLKLLQGDVKVDIRSNGQQQITAW
ncbi:cytochrome P450 [Castilleja foliolosa]|uniref:Cytochrome P450 n=1 Tax=Castilleja foliolosa TaxID=1961234 RepID=A0ABD3EKG9_9LAMI